MAYDGTGFHGFAKQQGLRTVEGVLEHMLCRISGQQIELFGSGRTDAGVHARAQVVHWTQSMGPPAEKYVYILRRFLPSDIVAIEAKEVPEEFHARFSAIGKTYRYTLQRSKIADVFTTRYAWHYPWLLNVEKMTEAAKYLIGKHDFTSFSATSSSVEDRIRTIYKLDVIERGTYLDIYCSGNGFLQHMVRIIVGTLVDVARGRYEPADIKKILLSKDRKRAGRTAPSLGLTLWEVTYPNLDFSLDS